MGVMFQLEHLIEGLGMDHITDTDMETFLEAIRTVCKEHKHEQEICRLVLRCVGNLVPHLCAREGEEVTENLRDSRTITLHILGVFW